MTPIRKFALFHFGISILLVIIIYIFFPKVYPGESFMIIWYYIMNLFIGIFLLPLFSSWMRLLSFKRRIVNILIHFFLILVILNLVPLFTGHIIYTIEVIKSMFKYSRMQIASIIEFLNPEISFLISYYIFRKSNLWTSTRLSEVL